MNDILYIVTRTDKEGHKYEQFFREYFEAQYTFNRLYDYVDTPEWKSMKVTLESVILSEKVLL